MNLEIPIVRFHEKLRQLKGEMSEAALAAASGLPYASVHSYCLGRRVPTFAAIVKLAAALGTDCQAFANCVLEPDAKSKSAKKPTATPAPRGRVRKEK